jgi:hypothetical protein
MNKETEKQRKVETYQNKQGTDRVGAKHGTYSDRSPTSTSTVSRDYMGTHRDPG